MNLGDGKLQGSVDGVGPGARAVALDATGARAYVATGDGLVVVDVAAHKPAGRLLPGTALGDLVRLPDGRVAVAELGQPRLTVVDPAAAAPPATVALPWGVDRLAQGGGYLYALAGLGAPSGNLAIVRLPTLDVSATVSVPRTVGLAAGEVPLPSAATSASASVSQPAAGAGGAVQGSGGGQASTTSLSTTSLRTLTLSTTSSSSAGVVISSNTAGVASSTSAATAASSTDTASSSSGGFTTIATAAASLTTRSFTTQRYTITSGNGGQETVQGPSRTTAASSARAASSSFSLPALQGPASIRQAGATSSNGGR